MIEIDLGNLLDLRNYFEAMPERTNKAASLAINRVAERQAQTLIKREMLRNIAFKYGYVTKHITVGRYASPSSPYAVIEAKDTPTTLFRFTGMSVIPNRKTTVKVTVGTGRTKMMAGAFYATIKGSPQVMIRTKDNSPPRGITRGGGKEIAPHLWLLYAPSVDQVFRMVADDEIPAIEQELVYEFERQFARLK